MRIVAATNDKPVRLDTVVTATASSDQLAAVLTQMWEPNALASPGPARVAMVQLSSGHTASVVFHERKNFLEILAPIENGVENGLADVLRELSIPASAITWTHKHIDRELLDARTQLGPAGLGTQVDVFARYLRESSSETRHELLDAYAAQLSAKQSELLYQRLVRLMKRHRTLADISDFEQIVAEDSIRGFSYWVDHMTTEYERDLRRYDRLSHSLSWLVIASGVAVSVSAFMPIVPAVFPLACITTLFAIGQVALRPERRVRKTQEFVDRFISLRGELETLSTMRDITPLNALQWQRLDKAIALIEE